MKRLRILALTADANPESISTSLVGYSHAEALARLHDVTLVIRDVNVDAIRRARAPFVAIEPIRSPWLDPFHAWSMKRIFKGDYGSQALTAVSYPRYVAFEHHAWRRLRRRITAQEFDVVLRLLPVTPVIPSPFAFYLRNGPIPFVIGPLNGGLPWPKGFTQAERQKEWVSNLRHWYRRMPFARSTFARAAAIIAASSHTWSEFASHRDKMFFVPENGINASVCARPEERGSRPYGKVLDVVYVGRLVPYKACDLALRAAVPLLRAGTARFTVIGDGPDRANIEQLARDENVAGAVDFVGWIPHSETLARLRRADVLLFPSIREFGGGVVFEALAVGAVPVVADFGGPGDIVTPEIGYKVPVKSEHDMVSRLESVLTKLAGDPQHLEHLRQRGLAHARERLTWDAKAATVTEILRWVTGQGPKPDLLPPPHLAVY